MRASLLSLFSLSDFCFCCLFSVFYFCFLFSVSVVRFPFFVFFLSFPKELSGSNECGPVPWEHPRKSGKAIYSL